MKKVFATLICAMMVFGLVGCGSNDNNSGDVSGEKEKSIQNEKKSLEIVDSGYHITGGSYVDYGIVIKNPNSNYSVMFPSYSITMYDENGKILGNEDQTMAIIDAGETISYGSRSYPNGTTPAKIEFKIKDDKSKYKETNKSINSFEISNTNEIIDEFGKIIYTGVVKNMSSKDASSVAISVLLYKDDKIVSGTSNYIDSVNANDEANFEVTMMNGAPDHDSYKITAMNW